MAAFFNKWFFSLLIPVIFYIPGNEPLDPVDDGSTTHPLHVSITEINHNAADRTLEISCKLFTDDFERVLTQNYKTKIDLINPPDRAAMDKLVSHFILNHLNVKADNKPLSLSYLGYERDNDAIYSYFQVEQLPAVKTISVNNTILFELFTDQINLMHVTVGGKRKSTKLDYPEKDAVFDFK